MGMRKRRLVAAEPFLISVDFAPYLTLPRLIYSVKLWRRQMGRRVTPAE